MVDTENILRQARALGEALAAHPRIRAYLDAHQAVQADEQAQRLLRDYTAQMEHIRRLERELRPVEVADKRRLADIEHAIASHDSLKQLMRTQADYMELLDQVHRAMDEPILGAPAGGAPPGEPAPAS